MVKGLTNDTEYSFRIRARNSKGDSDDSNTKTATPSAAAPANNQPKFSGATAVRRVDEHAATGLAIGDAVAASDLDGDTLAYSLSGANASSFAIDAGTGQIKTKAPLDYETKASYKVIVSVTDNKNAAGVADDNAVDDTIAVTITVNNVDDPGQPTGFKATAGDEQVTLGWDNPSDSTITKYQYRQKSGGSWGEWTDVPNSGPAAVGHTVSGLINGTEYTFQIRAHDSAGPGARSGSKSATPSTGNSDPTFGEGAEATRDVPENTAPGTAVGLPLAATDDDGDTLTYSLSGTDASSFAIVSGTGQIQTKAGLDYEAKASYSVTVTVTDNNGGDDTIAVTINVTNVDEAGSLTFSTQSPVSGTALVATLADPDGGLTANTLNWQWRVSTNKLNFTTPRGTVGTTVVADGGKSATSTYTPTASDVGKYVSVHVFYADGHGSGKRVPSFGRTHSGARVTAAPKKPAQPSGLKAVWGHQQVKLTWTDPSDSTITSYQYQQTASTGIPGNWTPIPNSGSDTVTHTVEDLINNTLYTFKIRAVNPTGNGAESAAVSATPDSLPVATLSADETATATEGKKLTFTLTLSKAPPEAVELYIKTEDGTAVAPGDYAETSWGFDFDVDDELTETLNVVSVDDSNEEELNEFFTVRFQPGTPKKGPVTIPASDADGYSVTGTIVDNDRGEKITSVAITSSPPSGQSGYYKLGDKITATVDFGQEVVVAKEPDAPTLTFKVGVQVPDESAPKVNNKIAENKNIDVERTVNCDSKSDDDTKLVCDLVVQDGHHDDDGIEIEANKLSLYRVTIRYTDETDVELDHAAVAASTDQKVDGEKPFVGWPSDAPKENKGWLISLHDNLSGIKKYGAKTVDGTSGTADDCDTASDIGDSNLTTEDPPSSLVEFNYAVPDDSVGKKICVYAQDAAGNTYSEVHSTAIAAGSNNQPTYGDVDFRSLYLYENEGADLTKEATYFGEAPAKDEDKDPLKYSLKQYEDGDKSDAENAANFAAFKNSFELDTKTGRFKTKVRVNYDYETRPFYTVVLEVSDLRDDEGVADTEVDDTIQVNVYLRNTVEAPLKPTVTSVAAQSGSTISLDVSWTAPENAGRPVVAGYQLQYRKGTSGAWQYGPQNVAVPGAGSTPAATVTGLDPNSTYQVRVRAHNAEGVTWSDPFSGKTDAQTARSGAPAKPTNLTATPGVWQVELGWDKSSNKRITKYQVMMLSGSDIEDPDGPDADIPPEWHDVPYSDSDTDSHTVICLPDGVAYIFRIRAVNARGAGPATNWTDRVDPKAPTADGAPFLACEESSDPDFEWSWVVSPTAKKQKLVIPFASYDDEKAARITYSLPKAATDRGFKVKTVALTDSEQNDHQAASVRKVAELTFDGRDLYQQDPAIAGLVEKGYFHITLTADELNDDGTVATTTALKVRIIPHPQRPRPVPLKKPSLGSAPTDWRVVNGEEFSLNRLGTRSDRSVVGELQVNGGWPDFSASLADGDSGLGFGVKVDDATSTVRVRYDGTEIPDGSITDGSVTVTVKVTDYAGRKATLKVPVRVLAAGSAIDGYLCERPAGVAAGALPTAAQAQALTDRAQKDCNLLLSAKSTLEGANTNSLDWGYDLTVDRWRGVTISSESSVPADSNRVVSLRVNNPADADKLAGTIPPQLGSLSKLTVLHLADNKLTGSIPQQLKNLSNLERLYLCYNKLTGSIPVWLGGTADLKDDLKVLCLSDNELTGAIPANLGSIPNLKRLALSQNQLTGVIPAELGGLAKLLALELHDNKLTGTIPAELGGLAELKLLWLHDNELSGCIAGGLASLAADNNGDDDDDDDKLSSYHGLGLHGNRLAGLIPHGFRAVFPTDTLPTYSADDHRKPTAKTAAQFSADLGLPWATSAGEQSCVEVPADWQYVPTGLTAGDSFRMLFITRSDEKTAATSGDIGTYNRFVQGKAAGNEALIDADGNDFSDQFRAVMSTSAVDARYNTYSGPAGSSYATGEGAPVYWVSGAKVADDYADFYDGTWDSTTAAARRDYKGNHPGHSDGPWTGSNNDGTKHASDYAGATNVRWGTGGAAADNPLSKGNSPKGNNVVLMALSPTIAVVSAAGATTGPVDKPAAPTGLTAIAGADSVALAWRNPNNNAIFQYQYRQRADTSAAYGNWTAIAGSGPATTAHTVTGLTKGTTYFFQIRARSAAGFGAGSQSVSATPGTVTVPADWGHIPDGVGAGESFRLLFVTSTVGYALPTADIADSNAIVQARANTVSDFQPFKSEFTALISTGTVDARDNTSTTGAGVPIHWVNGAQVADDYADFWDGSWDSRVWRTENGNTTTTGPAFGGEVWTGSKADGTKYVVTSGPANHQGTWHAGQSTVRYGWLGGSKPLSDWRSALRTSGGGFAYYGLSPVITVQRPPAGEDVENKLLVVRRDIRESRGRVALAVRFEMAEAPTSDATVVLTVTPQAPATTEHYRVYAGEAEGLGNCPAGQICLIVRAGETQSENALFIDPVDDGVKGPNEYRVLKVTGRHPGDTSDAYGPVELRIYDDEDRPSQPAEQHVSPDSQLIPKDAQGNPLVGPGDRFRLMFVTTARTKANESNINHYNNIVRGAAANATGGGANKKANEAMRGFSGEFRALVSTLTVNAWDNTWTDAVGRGKNDAAIYWASGDKVADSYADFWADRTGSYSSITWHSRDAKTEKGTTHTKSVPVFTGSVGTGLSDLEHYAGKPPSVQVATGKFTGSLTASGAVIDEGRYVHPLAHSTAPRNASYPLVAISPVINVVAKPKVTLHLSDARIAKKGGTTTLTVRQDRRSTHDTDVEIQTDPGGKVRTSRAKVRIPVGELKSDPIVLTAVSDAEGSGNQTVTIRFKDDSVSNGFVGAVAGDPATLTVVELVPSQPKVALHLSAAQIAERGGTSTLTARQDRRSSHDTDVDLEIASDGAVRASRGRVRIPAGELESDPVVLAAVNDENDNPGDRTATIRIRSATAGQMGVAAAGGPAPPPPDKGPPPPRGPRPR